MNISTYILMQESRRIAPSFFLMAAYLLLAVFALKDYLIIGTLQFLVGFPGLCYALHSEQRGLRSSRYGWVALIFMLLCCWLPVNTFLFFALSFSILFLLEFSFGKTGPIPMMMVVLLSPVFKYVINTFSWPLRLQLTKIAGTIFSGVGIETITRGNVIIQNNKEFSIDPGCMGLTMMAASLLFGGIVIAYFQQRMRRTIKVRHLLIHFSLVILLNIVANLFRIIILVYFSIPAESFYHDLAGIACLLPYVFYPSAKLAEYFVKRGNQAIVVYGLTGKLSSLQLWLHSLIIGCLIALAFYIAKADTYNLKGPVGNQVKGYETSLYEPGIIKLNSVNSLVYIKKIRGFYDTDHNPMICWKGSGFTLDHTEKRSINGQEVFTAWLINGDQKLYTAWWYSNGMDVVISQWDWRWNMLSKRESYALVNITCSALASLEEEIKKLKEQQILQLFICQ